MIVNKPKYLFTEKVGNHKFKEVMDDGQRSSWLKATASHVFALGIDADKGAARILEEIGVDKVHIRIS